MASYNLILNLTSECNMQCPFCYIRREKELYKNIVLNPENIKDVLNNLDVKNITISGGEPTVLPYETLFSILTKIREIWQGNIDFETNFTNPDVCFRLKDNFDINIVVGYDFNVRPMGQVVWQSLYEARKDFSLKLCVSPFLVKSYHPNLIIKKLSLLSNLKNVELVRYWKNENNQWNLSNSLYENYIQRFVTTDFTTNFKLLNKSKVLDGTYLFRNLYMQPNGSLQYTQSGTIIEFHPFEDKVYNMDNDFLTYTNDLVKFMKENNG